MHSELDLNYSSCLPNDKNARILDLGCGSGFLLNYLDSKGYQNYVGVDVDANILNSIDHRFKNKTQHITDLLDFLKSSNEKYDLIIAKDVIYYFPPTMLLRYMKAIVDSLHKDGVIIVEIFNGALLTAPYTAAKDYGIVNMFTEGSLRTVLEDAGLCVTELYGVRKIRKITLRSCFFSTSVFLWRIVLRIIYLFERGIDDRNPKIFEKSIIAVAKKS